MRTYGLRETLYREARQKGVHFIRYVFDKGLTVEAEAAALTMRFTDYVLQRGMELRPDVLVLASAIVSPKENPLAQLFKVPINDDGFFVEAHAKLRPVDFPTDGIFVCGLAHGPKPIDEAVAQAQAAAARAAVVLTRDHIEVEGAVSKIDEAICRGCGQCYETCPFQAISMVNVEEDKVVARVTEAICKGCGKCASTCPTGAASICHFTDQEILSMVDAALQD
jgi:heterodisulfide reductase subunit A